MSEVSNNDAMIRKSSLIAGIALVLMLPLAIFGNFIAVQGLVVEGNPAETLQKLTDSQTVFQAGAISLLLVAVLDIVVAWSLYRVFAPVREFVSKSAAIIRAFYALIFMVAISMLFVASNLISSGDAQAVTSQIDSFNTIWNAGLGIFGIHLLLLGYLAYKAKYAPRILGVLLAIAGAGYMIDSIGTIFVTDYSFTAAGITFIGEIFLIFWLFIKGRKVSL